MTTNQLSKWRKIHAPTKKNVFFAHTVCKISNVKANTSQGTSNSGNAKPPVIMTSVTKIMWRCFELGTPLQHTFKYGRKIHPSFFAVSADTLAAAIRKKKNFLLLSTLYQEWLQRAPGTRMYRALFEPRPGEKLKDSWKDSHSRVRGVDLTLGVCGRQRNCKCMPLSCYLVCTNGLLQLLKVQNLKECCFFLALMHFFSTNALTSTDFRAICNYGDKGQRFFLKTEKGK